VLKTDVWAMQYLINNLEIFQCCLTTPSVEALLSLKDTLHISDDRWHQVVATFQLGSGSSLYHIEKHRSTLNSLLPMALTDRGRGYEIIQTPCNTSSQ
jgi:hypothetical protein